MPDRELPVVLVKFGGSLITDKSGDAALRPRRLARLAAEMASALPTAGIRLLVGHGSGSFGHVAARRHGVDATGGLSSPAGAAAVQAAAGLLHAHVTEALRRAGVPVWSLPPSASMTATRGRVTSVAMAPLLRAWELGLVPVTHGDVVLDAAVGASICSTEVVLLALVRRLRRRGVAPARAYWFGDTDGVFGDDGRTVPRLTPDEAAGLSRRTGGAAGTDVTGGMRHRLETTVGLARLGVESWVLDGTRSGAVAAALRGEPLGGTHVTAAP